MKKLSVAEYRKILPILESHTKTTTFAYAVCDQVIDGEIFANEKLTAGLIRTANGIYYLFGDTDDQNYNEELFSYLKQLLRKQRRDLHSLLQVKIGK